MLGVDGNDLTCGDRIGVDQQREHAAIRGHVARRPDLHAVDRELEVNRLSSVAPSAGAWKETLAMAAS
ncbi:hypothetical protein [Streptacidiphilus sp. EB129]|uniref:hypothetical protein n=1 Tax=Streptacidiphilus sp. EB129 TaxID=3156262 RepID=UPI003514D3C8